MPSQRASYRRGVEFIALNDEPLDRDETSVRQYISTITLSEVFGKPTDVIAKDVMRIRNHASVRAHYETK